MLQLTDITKEFTDGTHSRTILDKLTLTVSDGEFVAITGESGAGKTTLLNILGTLLHADSGKYILGDREITPSTADLHLVRNKHIGIVFQDHRLIPQFTALQNILLPVLATNDKVGEESMKEAQRLMDFMGITHLKDQLTHTLSGGEKTRVSICRALINHPEVLLADEPTGQLDSDNTQTIAELFRRVNTELKTTIIMVTHSERMAQNASIVYRLEKGRLVSLNL